MAAHLIITADDFGYHPRYDAGILEAVESGALDAVSVMALRAGPLPAELTDSGLALGLHLEPGAPGEQIARFEALAKRPPDYLDGHRHCHATAPVTALAAERDLPVRSIDAAHRRSLREAGVRTPDRLIGRYEEGDPVLPPELGPLPPGWTEWMVHPGHAAGSGFSSYDVGREEDLRTLLGLRLPEGVSRSDQRSLPPPP
jgi:predicted glycoside hydrolase/deacetylase ChbG (UPF0249 family)